MNHFKTNHKITSNRSQKKSFPGSNRTEVINLRKLALKKSTKTGKYVLRHQTPSGNMKKVLYQYHQNGQLPRILQETFHIISSPEPWLIGELIVYQWSVVRPSVAHNAQRSSSPKPLVRSKPNFMWSLLG